MEKSKINEAAKILYRSRIDLKKIKELPKDSTPLNNEDAYAIQDEIAKLYLSANQKTSIIGKKIGCTNKDAQKQLNVNESFFGNIFSNNVSKSNCIIPSNNFFGPFIEPEFSFILKEELNFSNAPYSHEFIYQKIAAVLPSIEIVDSRYDDWTKVGVFNLIADNAAHAHWISGVKVYNLDQFDFKNHRVTLIINDKIVSEGNSNNVLDNPINSLTWLINNLALQKKNLSKNNYVSTGTCTPAIPINKNDKICADFGKLGKVNFNYI